MNRGKALTSELVYSDYTVYGYREPGNGSRKFRVEIGLMCPVCKALLPVVDHAESEVCQCGLVLTCHGNLLTCAEVQL